MPELISEQELADIKRRVNSRHDATKEELDALRMANNFLIAMVVLMGLLALALAVTERQMPAKQIAELEATHE